ncbi:hypothetical protein FJTKL_05278 [Diaporthe vaccinii]|uniref:Uncharacterized protein n=1 Tax=Diaporthe vaccinii TaxID=105482 RepID=A0ABR4FFU3_9PEZI
MERYRLAAEKPKGELPRAVLPRAVLPAAKAVRELEKVVQALVKEALELEKVVQELELELEREQQAEQRQVASRLLKTLRLCKEWVNSDYQKLDHEHAQDQL